MILLDRSVDVIIARLTVMVKVFPKSTWTFAAMLSLGSIEPLAFASLAVAAEPTKRVTFAVYRNGEEVGRHALTFDQNGSSQLITVAVDISVQKLGLVAYRYRHHGTERWSDDQLENLKTNTDDNGRFFAVDVRRSAKGFEVERSGLPPVSAADTMGGGLPKPDIIRELFPGDMLPTTLWNVQAMRRSALLNTQYGTLSRIRVEPMGREMLSLKSGRLGSTRYRVTGDLQLDQWFDDDSRWVKAIFRTPDGSTVDYVLQE
jgi:hypothetical protein